MKNKLIYYLLITCGFLFFIVAVDFGLGNILNKRSVNFFRIKHNYYHHGLLDSQASLGVWGGIKYPVYTNNYGFRDTVITEVKLNKEKENVLIIGDSHSEGVGLNYDKCFPSILQRRNEDLQIFNASAVSYSPKLYYLKLYMRAMYPTLRSPAARCRIHMNSFTGIHLFSSERKILSQK